MEKKFGHTGTLDPNATGVLPILIGEGTKLSKYLIEHDKIYKATLKLGFKTDTADIEGNIIDEKVVDDSILNKENIENILTSFLGKQEQTPPIFSAIKVNGKKLYEYARSGKNVEIPKRTIEIMNIFLNDIDINKKEIVFTVHCSKGTYIRSLCENIAEKIGTVGFMSELERLKVGKFLIEDSISIELLSENKDNTDFLKKHFITIENLFIENEKIDFDNKKLELFLNGVVLSVEALDGVYRVYNNNQFIGTGVVVNKKIKRDIIV